MESPGNQLIDDDSNKKVISFLNDSIKSYFQAAVQKLTKLHHNTSIVRIQSFLSQISMFPGAQLISMLKEHLMELKSGHYLCTEKTDGVRYLYYQLSSGESYLQNRKNVFYNICCDLIPFNNAGKSSVVHIFDGELIEEAGKLKFLVYDAIAVNKISCIELTYIQRLKCVQPYIYSKELNIKQTKNSKYITLLLKDVFPCSSISLLLTKIIPSLPHSNDGIVFTRNQCPYYPGTCNSIIKWKPTEKNTVDFIISGQLQCGFSEWIYVLNCNVKLSLKFFGYLFLKDIEENNKFKEKWKLCKNMGLSYPVAECFYDYQYETEDLIVYNYLQKINNKHDFKSLKQEEKLSILASAKPVTNYRGGWRIIKYRFDKTTANAWKIAQNVLRSINDNVSEAELMKFCNGVNFLEEITISEVSSEKLGPTEEEEEEKKFNEDEIDDYANSGAEVEPANSEREDIFGLANVKRKKLE